MIEDPCEICGKDSSYGCHGIDNGVVTSVYFCEEHGYARYATRDQVQAEAHPVDSLAKPFEVDSVEAATETQCQKRHDLQS